MPGSTNIDRALGIVIGKLDGIEDRLNRQDESRARMHEDLNAAVMRITHIENDQLAIKNKVDAAEKVTVEVTTLRTKAEGAGTVGRWLLRAGIVIVSFAGWAVGVYTYVTGRPPP